MMDDFNRAYGIRSVRLRYFNAAGADPDGEIGERHDPETHLVPLVIETAPGRREYIDIFGTDYPTRDGTAIRDYIHVSDLASAHVAALKHLLDGGETKAVNLGTGIGASVEEVITEVETISGRSVPRRLQPRREGDPAQLIADPTAAMSLLGWQATRNLSDIIRDAHSWLRGQNE